MVCTLIDNDTRHHSGQNVVDSKRRIVVDKGTDHTINHIRFVNDISWPEPLLQASSSPIPRIRKWSIDWWGYSFRGTLGRTVLNSLPHRNRTTRVFNVPVFAWKLTLFHAFLPTVHMNPGALSIRPKIPEIPGWGANGTVIFRNFIPKFWVYLARLA